MRRGTDGSPSPIRAMDFYERRESGIDSRIPELDHIVPAMRGGTGALDNLAYACRRCNHRKEIRTAFEFWQYPNDAITQQLLPLLKIKDMLVIEAKYNWD